jgi:hypothetical protein
VLLKGCSISNRYEVAFEQRTDGGGGGELPCSNLTLIFQLSSGRAEEKPGDIYYPSRCSELVPPAQKSDSLPFWNVERAEGRRNEKKINGK